MILYDRSNQPYRVYDKNQAKVLIKEGFTERPKPNVRPVSQVIRAQDFATSAGLINKTPPPLIIKVNTCTTAELTKIAKIGTAKAKKIEEARPIQDVGDLLDLFPDHPWMSVATLEGQPIKLDYTLPDDKK